MAVNKVEDLADNVVRRNVVRRLLRLAAILRTGSVPVLMRKAMSPSLAWYAFGTNH